MSERTLIASQKRAAMVGEFSVDVEDYDEIVVSADSSGAVTVYGIEVDEDDGGPFDGGGLVY